MNASFNPSNATANGRANPQVIGNGKTRLNRVVAALRDMVLGEADPTSTGNPRGTRQGHAALDVELLPAQSPKGALMLNALAEAISQFRYEEVQPHLDYSPEDVYQVHQVCVVETPENLALLSNFARLAREPRIRAVKKVFEGFIQFDTSALADVRIVKAPSHELDPVFILAGGGAQRAQIAFEFHGEFVCAATPVAEKSPPAATHIAKTSQPLPSNTGTVLPPAPKPSQVGTVLPPATVQAATPTVLMTLHIQEPGKTERSVAISKFPCRIGRSEDSDVVIESANISRTHVLLVQDAGTGHFRVVDQSKVGTLLGTRALAKGDEVSLVDGQVLTLAPGESSNPVTIHVACPVVTKAIPVQAKPANPPNAEGLISRAMAGKTVVAGLPPKSLPAAATVLHRQEPALYLDDIGVKPIARLHVHYGNGQKDTCDIGEFPFEIGREPEQADNSFGIAAVASRVSRQHLRIDRLQAGVFNVQNLAVGANGTWFDGEKLLARFTLVPGKPGQGQPLLLGEKTLGSQAAAVFVELL